MELPWHPFVVHFPVALVALLLPLAIAVVLQLRRGAWPASTWWLVVALQLTLVATAYVAAETGETREHEVEELVGKALVHAHEEQAEMFIAAAVAAGALALATSFVAPGLRLPLQLVTLMLMLAQLGLALRAGHSGATLVHGPERQQRKGQLAEPIMNVIESSQDENDYSADESAEVDEASIEREE